jgi:hypothetical protein
VTGVKARAVRCASLLLGALLCAPRPARAADGTPAPARTRAPCSLPHFEGTLVSKTWPPVCSPGRPCVTARELTLEDAEGTAVFGIDATTAAGALGPPALACDQGFVVLRYRGEQLRFDFHGGRIRLEPGDRGRIVELWSAPEARTRQGIDAHAVLAGALGLVRNGAGALALSPPAGVDDELVDTAILVSARDQLRAGRFQLADDGMAALEAAGAPPRALPRKIVTRLRVLRHELAAARRRTQPFALGPRRFAGGAHRTLRTPLDPGGPPDLFFRGAELCVVDVAPARAESAAAPAWPEDGMHCFEPAARTPRAGEPAALPRSSLSEVARLDDANTGDVLAVLDGGALLELSGRELVLVRALGRKEPISPAEARELVAGSAGSRLVTRTASYFSDPRHIAQVAGDEAMTWEVFGPAPDGTRWLGTPLVSPDERWVTAQSGDGAGAVSLWVFPIR